jgi:UDP-N-acetylglucosamine transferase subunit ALG13
MTTLTTILVKIYGVILNTDISSIIAQVPLVCSMAGLTMLLDNRNIEKSVVSYRV